MIPILFVIPKFNLMPFILLILLSAALFGLLFLLFRKRVDSVKQLRKDLTGYYFFTSIILALLYLFGPFPVRTYGVMIALGFFIGILVARPLFKKSSINPDAVFDIAIYIVMGVIIGARLFYIIFYDWHYFINNPLKIIAVWEGGLVLYGGLIGGCIAGIYKIKKMKLSLLKTLDIFGVIIPLGVFFGRFGCLGYGCCFGRAAPEWFPFKIRFPAVGHVLTGHTPAFSEHLHQGLIAAGDKFSLPVYPSQFISSLNGMFLFIVLWFLFKKKKFDGQIIALSLMFYAVTRFLIEFIRVEPNLLGLNVSQWIGIFVFTTGLLILNYARNHAEKSRSL